MTKAKATALMTKPLRADLLEDGYQRSVSTKQKVEVYFRKGTPGVAVVTTWNRRLKTAEGIGPCSTVASLKKAYGARLKPFRQSSKTYAYRIGNLVFAIAGSKVAAVAIGRGPSATYVALNVTPCR